MEKCDRIGGCLKEINPKWSCKCDKKPINVFKVRKQSGAVGEYELVVISTLSGLMDFIGKCKYEVILNKNKEIVILDDFYE